MNGIAIVGMACRYPDASSPAELWENVLAERRAFRRIPAERLDLADYPSPGGRDGSLGAPDGIYVHEAAVLEGWELDRVRFRVVGSTYRSADLAHWLALDVADQALADAGFGDGRGLPREATGVLVGNSLTGEFSRAQLLRLRWPYVNRVLAAALSEEGWSAGDRAAFLGRLEASYKQPFPPMNEESLAGGLSNTIAGRICNHFDFQGGGYTVDGACASSLLAVAQACSALAAGDLDVALAGGVDLSLDPFELVGFSRAGALAEGEMRVYDRRSAGFLPGEGCGFVVLMRHADALAQGRRVLAVLRGWGISSDGHGGLSRPEAAGQLLALERAYRRAGCAISEVPYFEGHGTGTAVGDATELAALGLALAHAHGKDGERPSPLPAVGSVKANLGHTKAAAGLAGLLKAVLAVGHQVLPPNTGCEEPHPELLRSGLRTLSRPEAWPADRPLLAGVSAMGFGGINGHLVIEGTAARRRRALGTAERRLAGSVQDAELLLLAAPDRAALRRQVERLLALVPRISRSELTDLAATLARGLKSAPVRAAVVAARPADLAERLETLLGWLDKQEEGDGPAARMEPRRGLFLGSLGVGEQAARPPRIGFLFPGQGSPAHLGGGRWRRRFEAVEEIYERAGLPERGSEGGDGAPEIPDTAVAQPAIVTHSLAGLAVLGQLGIEGAVGVGHSLGEISALGWAGAFGEGDLLRIATARGRAMAEITEITEISEIGEIGEPTDGNRVRLNLRAVSLGRSAQPGDRPRLQTDPVPAGAIGATGVIGGMGSIAADPETVAVLLAPGAVLAGFNGPASTVISGEVGAVDETLGRARSRGFSATRLKVSHAFHSPLVAAAGERLAAELAITEWTPLSRRVASTVTGGLLDPAADLSALLLAQVTSPVRFTAALAAVADEVGEVDLWIEVGPGRVLADLVADFLPTPVVALDAGGPSLSGLLEAAGMAFCLGAPIDPAGLFADRFTRPFDLDYRPRFLVNPCELAPRLAADAPAVAAALSMAAAPVAPLLPTAAPAPVGASPLDVVRQLVAARAELPETAVREDSRLLSDLHLNSISVGQLVVEASRQLGLEPPVSPSDYAQATVGEVALVLAEQIEQGGQFGSAGRVGEEGPPAGVDSWVRAFTVAWVERPLPKRSGKGANAVAGSFQIFAPENHPLAGRLADLLAASGAGPGVAVCLPAAPDVREGETVELLLEAARAVAVAGSVRFLVVQEDGGGGGFARTLHLELPEVATCVVDLPFDHPRAAEWAAEEVAALASGYSEASYDTKGVRRVPVLRLLPEPETISAMGPGSVGSEDRATGCAERPKEPARRTPRSLDPAITSADVLLVTGGGKGIAAECALDLARSTGARVALLGRSRPETDPELSANLERFLAAGVAFRYQRANVTDPAAVRRAVSEVEAALGPITGVLHGAGVNSPRLLGQLDAAAVRSTLAPKLGGAENLLAALDPERLRLFISFGSILARTGMRGEADYALANEWLARFTERLQERLPACRCLALEWSVWAGVGMGERLGRLAALLRQGITPIPLDAGVGMLRRLLARPLPEVSVVVAGRFGEPPTLAVERPELPLLRFLERPRVYYPGVELVVDTELSAGTDPYLEDHVFRGDRLFPAALGLEAMAQAAIALLGVPAGPPVFESVSFPHPVVVPEKGSAIIRVAALVRGPGVVEAVLRTAASGFAVDHFRATCRFGEAALAGEETPPVPVAGESIPMEILGDLYGGVLFHTGRFRRVSGYRQLSATACLADISPDGTTAWFGRYLPPDLVLGDPGVRDAAIHGIQACIPHRTLLPVGVERIVATRLGSAEPAILAARERERHGDTFVYDLELRDAAGQPRERWEGLTLRAVDAIPAPAAWSLALLGPFLERRLADLVPGAGVRVALGLQREEGAAGGRAASGAVLGHLLGSRAAVHRRPDGRPEVAPGPALVGPALVPALVPDNPPVSVSYAGDVVLAVAGPDGGIVGCDLEPVRPRSASLWRDLLGAQRFRLAELLAGESGEAADSAATRIWAAAECLTKAGGLHGAPLVLGERTADGWQLLRSGDRVIGTLAAPVRELGGPQALAVLAVLVGAP